jgi:hypothetical protein
MRISCYVAMALSLFALATSAAANQWWVSYEGNDYPENEGWERYTHGGGAQRSLVDGSLVIDSLASPQIADDYTWYLPSLPGPGETFRAEWRLRLDTVNGPGDNGVCAQFAGHGDVFLIYTADRIISSGEAMWIATFAPGVFHDYVLTSSDLERYNLYIDGTLVHTGVVNAPSPGSYFGWGDTGYGGGITSLSTWDYLRFGCVPEPFTGALLGPALVVLSTRKARSTWRN